MDGCIAQAAAVGVELDSCKRQAAEEKEKQRGLEAQVEQLQLLLRSKDRESTHLSQMVDKVARSQEELQSLRVSVRARLAGVHPLAPCVRIFCQADDASGARPLPSLAPVALPSLLTSSCLRVHAAALSDE